MSKTYTKAKVYSSQTCTWCNQAKNLLKSMQIPYEEIMLGKDISIMEFSKILPDAKTVPQIFLDDQYVGGFDKLKEALTK